MQTVDTAERRALLGLRHGLAAPLTGVEAAADGLIGLHSSDPASVFLAARARVDGFAPADLEEALYESKDLLRILGMRRTMFVVPRVLAGVIDAACTRVLAPAERRRTIKLIEDQGLATDGAGWIDRVAAASLTALADLGEATAKKMTEAVPELALRLSFGEGTSWAGTVGMSTRMLFLLATEGRIVRGRPLGSWISSQYRWAIADEWVPGGFGEVDPVEARADLVRRWLRSFGPGTLIDLKWWTGWTVAQTRRALADVSAIEVTLDEGTGYVLADDDRPDTTCEPWVALLPSLDSTVMGWKERDWYLGGHSTQLFDRNGNAGPTVWCDGRIVGGWAHRPDGEVAVELLEDVGSEAAIRIESEARSLQTWLGDVRVTPRFRTPLEKSLTA